MPHVHQRFPGLSERLPHLRLGSGPTPVRRLTGLERGAAELWLKDEGAYGDGPWGGNKVRKLEWLLPDVRRRGRTTILTVGGLGTNWGYAAAAYGAEHGIHTVLALVDQPVDDHVRAQLARLRGSGATLHFTGGKARTIAAVPALMVHHASGFRPPYLLPAGGSSPLGAVGYVETALEIAEQVRAGELPEPSHVVTAVGSGGTAAGLALGLRLAGLSTQVLAVVVNDSLRLDRRSLTRLARRSGRLLRQRGAELREPEVLAPLTVSRDWLGPGYGHPTRAAETATRRTSDDAGLQLDPVYTAKAMAALLELDAAGGFGRAPVLFLHTNGPRRGRG